MDGLINEKGYLFIYRKGRDLKAAECPVNSTNDRYICGDWCAKFKEPVHSQNRHILEICDKDVIVFESLVDERI